MTKDHSTIAFVGKISNELPVSFKIFLCWMEQKIKNKTTLNCLLIWEKMKLKKKK